MNSLIGKKGDKSEGRNGIEVRAAFLRVKIRNSDSENSRSTCFDWHNFIRTYIKYEILLQILFFGLALFFKFLILTCLFKKISASLRGHATFVLPLFSPPGTKALSFVRPSS